MVDLSLGKFNADASFYATKTSKLGKNEIHIYPLQHENSKITAPTSLSSSFELDSQDELVSFEWIQNEDQSKGKRLKRRHSVNGSTQESSNSLSYLAASFKSGTILVYSPFKKEIINEFKTDLEISALASSLKTFWVAASNEVHEFELNESKSKKQITLPIGLNNVSSIKHTIIDDEEFLLVGGNKLVVYNITKDELINEYPVPKGKKLQTNSIAYTDNHVSISREGDSNIYTYSLTNRKSHSTLSASKNIESLTAIDDNTIAALLENGSIEIFKNITDSKGDSSAFSINTNNKEIGFSSFTVSRNKLAISWFDLEPKFQLIKISGDSTDIEIDIKHTAKAKKQEKRVPQENPAELTADSELEVRDSDFASVIEKELKEPVKLLTILISNPDLNKIKYTASQLESETAVELFKILKERVEINPSESYVFNEWIKWLLLSQSSVINSSINLKSLKSTYSKSLKQLPNLLSLQGRLEMLQSQLQLRNQIANSEVLEAPSKDPVEKAEESIVYVNGENDEEDDVIGSVGNSESEEEPSEDEATENGEVLDQDDE